MKDQRKTKAQLIDELIELRGRLSKFEAADSHGSADNARLKSDEEHFRLLFERSPLAYQSLDANGCIIEVNPVWLETLGYGRDEVIGRWIGDFLTAESVRLLEERFPEFLKAGQVCDAQFEFVRKDGSQLSISVDGRIGYDQKGTFKQTHCVLRDITEQKLTVEALRDSEEKFRTLYTCMAEGVCLHEIIYDDSDEPVDYRIIDINPAYESILSLKREDAVGALASQFYGSGEAPYLDLYARVAHSGRPEYFETYFPPMDKHFAVSVFSPGKGKFATVFSDITQRRQTEDLTRVQRDLALALSSTSQFDEAMALCLDTALAASRMDSGGIYIVDENTGAWVLTVSSGLTPEFIRSGSRYEADSPNAHLVLAGEPVYRNREEMSELTVNVQTSESLTALAVLPISSDGQIIACLNVASHVIENVPPPARNTLEAIAAEIGSTISRLRTEAALKESLQTSADIVNSIPSGLFIYQFIEPDRLFLIESNPEAERLTGVLARESRDKEFDEIWSNAKSADLKDAILGSFRNDKTFETEDVHYKDDRLEGAYRIKAFRIPGNKLGVAFEDITDLKRAVDGLRDSEQRFRELSELLPQTVFELNIKGIFTYTNKYGLESTGYTWEDVKKGVHVLKLFMPQDRRKLRERMAQIIQGAPPEGCEYSLRRKDGSCFPVMVYASRILRDGQPAGVRGIAVDMTETKRLQEFADRAHRLETAGRIAGQVAHDFNNLLGPLVAYPELVKEELGPSHPAAAYLNSMESVAQQMADINQQLLTLGRRGHYNMEPLNLNDIIKEVVEQMYPCPSTLAVETNLCPDLMNINAGVSQIFRVISNLVVNAVDALQGIGTLAITTENWYADDTKGNYGQIPRGEYVKMTITDTGCGIPQEAQSRIFEPFFTSKKTDKRKGSGLGLSVVHAVVEDHGGYLDLESQVGEGTSVYLYFPITRDEVAVVEQATIQGGSELILVVDDDAVQRDVTSMLLSRFGYQVRSVESGEKAIEFLKSQQCDLILLDMIMPGGMNGSETYKQALGIYPDLKAIIVSGYAESEQVTEAQDRGAGKFLRKPLTLEAVAQAVRSELDRVRSAEPVA